MILVCAMGRASVCHQRELRFPSRASVCSPLMSAQDSYVQRDSTVLPSRAGAGESGPSTNQPRAPKFPPGQAAALPHSLFKHLVARSVHLIKPEISFPPVGSATVHLSQSTYGDRFGRRCPFLFPPTSLHLSGLEGMLCGSGLSWQRRCWVSPCRSQNIPIGELLACSIQ